MIRLIYPQKQSIALSNQLLQLYKKAVEADKKEDIVFDFSKSVSLTPVSIIIIAITVSECMKQGKKCSYRRPKNLRLLRFLNEMGFFSFFKPDKKPEPVRIESAKVQLRKLDGINPLFIDELIEMLEFHLNMSKGVKGSLRMSLTETMANVIDHSLSEGYYICSVLDKRKKQIRLCIADLGIGILDSLRSYSKYEYLSDAYQAIKKATEKNVTSNPERNAGLGLNHIKKFLDVNEGQLCIISQKGKVFWKFDQSKVLEQTMKIPFPGTIIKMLINTDKTGFYLLESEADFLF